MTRFQTLVITTLIGLPLVVALWAFVFGLSAGSSTRMAITRVQYFANPPLVAIHVDGPPSVFIIQNINGSNREAFAKWLNPANVDLKSIDVIANSTYIRWFDHLEDRDKIQFGVQGLALGSTLPTFPGGKEVAVCIMGEDFPRGSFEIIGLEDLSAKHLQTPVADTKVYGWLTFSTYWKWYLGSMPRRYPG